MSMIPRIVGINHNPTTSRQTTSLILYEDKFIDNSNSMNMKCKDLSNGNAPYAQLGFRENSATAFMVGNRWSHYHSTSTTSQYKFKRSYQRLTNDDFTYVDVNETHEDHYASSSWNQFATEDSPFAMECASTSGSSMTTLEKSGIEGDNEESELGEICFVWSNRAWLFETANFEDNLHLLSLPPTSFNEPINNKDSQSDKWNSDRTSWKATRQLLACPVSGKFPRLQAVRSKKENTREATWKSKFGMYRILES